VAIPSAVFTIARVAGMLGEDQAFLQQIALAMQPEDGCLEIWDTDDDIAITAFTELGVEQLRQLIALRKERRP
jgi:hypothetical protein